MRLALLISLFAASILICLAAACASTGGADNQTLVLEQQHAFYNKVNVYLNKTFIFAQIPSRHIELYAKAPEWNVICRNLSRRQYSNIPYRQWITTGPSISFNRTSKDLEQWKSIKTGTETYKGLPVTRYQFPRKYKSGEFAPLSVGNEGYALGYEGPEATEKAANILDALLELWRTPGIQLKIFKVNGMAYFPFRTNRQSVNVHDLLTTLKWSRTTTKPVFDLKGYKEAAKNTEIWYSETEQEMLEDVM